MQESAKFQELPPDNASRLAIFDAISEHVRLTGAPNISDEDLFDRVIGRLRVLVPRELHLAGDQAYVHEKIEACLQAGIIVATPDNGRRLLTLTDRPPQIRYPNGEVRDYPAGLELARERIDRDNARLRAAVFDVREFIPSIADDPDGDSFRALLASMREHGFMKQFPILTYGDGEFVDGRARHLAATILELKDEYLRPVHTTRKAANSSDTPINRILVAIHSNIGRLPSDVVDAVYKHVADVTNRTWAETAADLEFTQEWRRSMVQEYTPWFNVTKRVYRKSDEPKVQVTADRKVMIRSLVEAAGLPSYKMQTQLGHYVPFEEARTEYSGGRKAGFARAEDLISGIEAMQQERLAARRKIDPEWDQVRDWLVRTLGPAED